jgi:hypothetical protein
LISNPRLHCAEKNEEKMLIFIAKIIVSIDVRIGRVVISLVIHPANLLFYKGQKKKIYCTKNNASLLKITRASSDSPAHDTFTLFVALLKIGGKKKFFYGGFFVNKRSERVHTSTLSSYFYILFNITYVVLLHDETTIWWFKGKRT